jgi:molybdenum cofactor cytidylyltransferase
MPKKESRIPTEAECLALMDEIDLAPTVRNHSLVVQKFALCLADDLAKQGVKVDKNLVSAAALLHDIMKLDAQFCHGIEGGEFLRKKGFHEVASVVEKHCLNNLDDPYFVPRTTEEKLLMYADLRVGTGKIVSLSERFKYIKEKYNPNDPMKFNEYMAFAKQLEWELLGKLENIGEKDGRKAERTDRE